MSSWNDSLHFCKWSGVVCGRRHQRVTILDLESSQLTGTLSPLLGNLSFLRELHLQSNSFMGTIPPEIGRLHKLQYLLLYNNSIQGEIPTNISYCSKLIQLNLAYNKLVGSIPSELGSLVNLQLLHLGVNNLTGIIPSSIGNFTSLSELHFSTNELVGTIPNSLGRLKKLTILALSLNRLSGIVPPSIFNISTLRGLDLGENGLLEGSLPLDLGIMLPNLQFLSIETNQFMGSIPASMSNSSNLVTLQVEFNNLQGLVPSLHKLKKLQNFVISGNFLGAGQPTGLNFVSSLANASNLQIFDISQNNFSGSFPSILCNFSTLAHLGLRTNKIFGEIPSCIGNLKFLRAFQAKQNQLSGTIPSSIGKLQNLGFLHLGTNQLSGSIPSSIGNLTKLAALSLSKNNLEGNIPPTLGNYKYLQELDLSQNSLGGGIPSQLLSVSSLSIVLDLSNNPLTGVLPDEVGELKNLVVFDVSNTTLSGEIPSTLGECTSLQYLFMGGNFFQGLIPPGLNALRDLRELDLSHNNLSGEIPKFLAKFPLKMLNLSYNRLEGEVPTGGVFINITGLSILGNNGLCGGISGLKLTPCNSSKILKRGMGNKRRIMIAIFSAISGVLMLAGFASLYVFFHKKRMNEVKIESENSLPNMSYQSLLKATDGFSSENLIGSGTFGVVYKGTLHQDQAIVAIKVFNLEHRGASKSFMAECEVLKNVRHRNLIKVITACSGIDYQGNDFKALVYEYMANGNLDDWLHQKPSSIAEGTSEPPGNLNFLRRLDIAMDVAFALEYLHHRCGASIVHCDLKPSNILLDREMVARVGDFGLAKFLSQGITNSNSNQSSSIGVRGTIGYAPPEYGMGNEPSIYGDVYSFGILLLEIFTGKRPTNDMFKEGLSLYGFVKEALPDHMIQVVDHALLSDVVGDGVNTSGNVMSEALTAVLGIALSCSAEIPHDRLGMTVVAAKLSSIQSKLLGTRLQQQRRNLQGN